VEIGRLEEAKALVRLYCQDDDGKYKEKVSSLSEMLQNLFQFYEDVSKRVHKERNERRNKYNLLPYNIIRLKFLSYHDSNFIAS
jgi:hypothetical protein